ncbi:MAG TPA: hypothetical protein VGJ86_24640 [Acidimicrobiales bacterium]
MNTDEAGTGWSVPGSQAEPAATAATSATAVDGPPAPPGSLAPDATPVQFNRAGPLTDLEAESGDGAAAVPRLKLQPMTVADILDGAFSIIKARPARILGITALFVVPTYFFAAFLQRDAVGFNALVNVFTSDDPAVTADAASNSGPGYFENTLTLLLPILALVFVAAAIAHLAGAWTVGRDVPAGELLTMLGRRSWALFASFLLVHAFEALGIIACYVGIAFLMPFFSVTAPVIGAEGLGPLAAMRRSANLATRRYWAVFGIGLLIALTSTLLGYALGRIPMLVADLAGYDWPWPVNAAGAIVGAVVVTPFVGAATSLLYLDLRVRTEGLDIELAAIDLAHDAA